MNIKNPFSLYDFLGYFFPGAFALIMIIVTIEHYEPEIPSEYQFDSYKLAIEEFLGKNVENIDLLRFWLTFILVAYVLGHITSYLSSITVEFFMNESFQYPSMYLLGRKDEYGDNYWKRYWRGCNLTFPSFLRRFFTFIFLLPISIWFLIPWLSGDAIAHFVYRPLDTYLIQCIKTKLRRLHLHLHVASPPTDQQSDIHRIVMHYVYLNYPLCRVKGDNYIAIYGFLRAMALILCINTIIIVISVIIFDLNRGYCQFYDWILPIVLWVMSFVCFLGFVKFYRRFTLENYMTLLVGDQRGIYYTHDVGFSEDEDK